MRRFFVAVHAQRRAVALLFAAAIVLGAVAVARMPASIMPEVTFPRITVIADAGELPAATVVRTVTMPLESAVRRIPHVREVRTTTSRGSVEMNLDCDWGSDMDLTLQRVQAQVEAARGSLPPGTRLDARLMSPRLFPVLGYSLTSRTLPLAQLRDLADFTLKPELARLPGVADVVVQGGRPLEARVTLDPARLRARGLDVAHVTDAIRHATLLESVGLLETNGRLYLGLADGRPHELEDLRAIAIPVAGGPPVVLGEVATVELAEAPAFVRYQAQGREAVLVNLLRQPSASSITLADATRRWFADHRDRLPRDVSLQVFYDQSDLVRGSVGSARDSLLVGALLAVAVILLVLRRARLGLAAAAVLPGSIAITLLALALLGQSLDMMTLGGIAAAVGLVLDDAIVVVEHLAHRAEAGGEEDRPAALAELFPTLAGSTACTLAIFLPFLFLDGVTGAFFRVLTLAMALMLGASFVLCLTIVPLLAPSGTPAAPRGDRPPGRFARLTAFAARRPAIGVIATLVLIGLAVPLQGTLGTGFLPDMDEGSLIMDYVSPPGTSLVETDRVLRQVEATIDATPEVAAWSRRTGDQLGFFITEPNVGDYVLRLKPKRARSADAVADDLRARIEGSQPSLQIEFGQLVEDVIGDLTSNPQPIEIRVFSEDRDLAERKAREIAALVGRVRGTVDVKDGIVVSGPDVTLVTGAAGARRGLSTEDLADDVTPAVGGVDLGEIVRGARVEAARGGTPSRGRGRRRRPGGRAAARRRRGARVGSRRRHGAGERRRDRDRPRRPADHGRGDRAAVRPRHGLRRGRDPAAGEARDRAAAAGHAHLRRPLGAAAVVVPRPRRGARRRARARRADPAGRVPLVVAARVPARRRAGVAHGRARRAVGDGQHVQHLELRRRDHARGHRRGERLLPARRMATAARRRPRSRRGIGGRRPPPCPCRVDDHHRRRRGAGAARARARHRRLTAAPARDRRHRRLHAVVPAAARRPAVAARPLRRRRRVSAAPGRVPDPDGPFPKRGFA